jgi:hypothetical protein
MFARIGVMKALNRRSKKSRNELRARKNCRLAILPPTSDLFRRLADRPFARALPPMRPSAKLYLGMSDHRPGQSCGATDGAGYRRSPNRGGDWRVGRDYISPGDLRRGGLHKWQVRPAIFAWIVGLYVALVVGGSFSRLPKAIFILLKD